MKSKKLRIIKILEEINLLIKNQKNVKKIPITVKFFDLLKILEISKKKSIKKKETSVTLYMNQRNSLTKKPKFQPITKETARLILNGEFMFESKKTVPMKLINIPFMSRKILEEAISKEYDFEKKRIWRFEIY